MLFGINLPHGTSTTLPQLCETLLSQVYYTGLEHVDIKLTLSNYRSQLILNWFSSGRVVFQIPDWLHHLLMGARILFKNTLEMYTDYYLQCKLEQLFQEHRLVSLITLLRGLYLSSLFCVLCL